MMTIYLDIDDWQPGDAVAERDSNGLPFLPGPVVKGLLLRISEIQEHYGQLPAGTTDGLMESLIVSSATSRNPTPLVTESSIPLRLEATITCSDPGHGFWRSHLNSILPHVQTPKMHRIQGLGSIRITS